MADPAPSRIGRPDRPPGFDPPVDRSALTTPVATPDGGIVVVKVRRPRPWAVEATAAEANWLAAAAGPGVVPLVAAGPDRLATGWAGPVSVASCLDTLAAHPAQVVAVVTGVAVVLGRIGALGLVHGGLRADHVILGGAHRTGVALCSPGVADRGTAMAQPGPASGPPADDLAALGALAARLSAGWRHRHQEWDRLVTALQTEPERLDPSRLAGRLAELRPPRPPGFPIRWPDRIKPLGRRG